MENKEDKSTIWLFVVWFLCFTGVFGFFISILDINVMDNNGEYGSISKSIQGTLMCFVFAFIFYMIHLIRRRGNNFF